MKSTRFLQAHPHVNTTRVLCLLLLTTAACGTKANSSTKKAPQDTESSTEQAAIQSDAGTNPAQPDAADPFAGCDRGEMEADFGIDVPLTGPGVDPDTATVRAGDYVLATTYLAVEPSKIEQAQALGGAVLDSLSSMNGLVAFSLSYSMMCATLRTLTVWESEEDMLGLVLSPAHVTAMSKTPEVSRGTSATTSWSGTAADVAWDVAIQRLSARDVALH